MTSFVAPRLARFPYCLKYFKKIPVESREYSKNISDAFLLFGKGKFDEVLGIITSLQHPNFMLKVRMKHLKAKCLYELNDQITFDSEYKSTYHFLKNNILLSPKVKNETKYLFDRIKNMFRLKEKFSSYEFEKLKNEISMGTMNKNSWLNLKVNEFKLRIKN